VGAGRWPLRRLSGAAVVRVGAVMVAGAEDLAWLAGLYARASYRRRCLSTTTTCTGALRARELQPPVARPC